MELKNIDAVIATLRKQRESVSNMPIKQSSQEMRLASITFIDWLLADPTMNLSACLANLAIVMATHTEFMDHFTAAVEKNYAILSIMHLLGIDINDNNRDNR